MRPPPEHRPLDRRTKLVVLGLAAAVFVVLLAVAGRYGFHRDELYFLEASRHLDWGYVDFPPFVPVVAWLSTRVFGDGLVAIRVVPALAAATTVVVVGLLARELGGSPRAQRWAAAVAAVSGFPLGAGHLLGTAVFDYLAWMVLLTITARLLRTNDVRLWLAFGLVGGVALWNKHLVWLLAASVGIGLVADRRWDLLRPAWLGAGAAVAALVAAPTLVWQAVNDFPQLEMARAISERIGGENRALLVPGQLFLLGPFLVPLLYAGVRALGSGPHRAFRPLLWAGAAGMLVTFATAGRPYYPIPLTAAVITAGVVAVDRGSWARRRRAMWVAVGGNAVVVATLALPVLPIDWIDDFPPAEANETAAESIGWPEMVEGVAAVVAGLPAAERDEVVLLTATYGEAGAIDRHGPRAGLPRVSTPHNNYWHWRRPTDDRATVVSVRYEPHHLAPYFDACTVAARVANGRGVVNEVSGTPILVCRGLRGTWDEVWDVLRRYS